MDSIKTELEFDIFIQQSEKTQKFFTWNDFLFVHKKSTTRCNLGIKYIDNITFF